MTLLLIILSLLIMLLIAAEDLRYRKIRIVWLALLNALGLLLVVINNRWDVFGESLLVLLVILTLLTGYILLRFGTGRRVFGWGDVWMLLALPSFVATDTLLQVIIGSALVSVGWMLLQTLILKRTVATIPYAGLLSLSLGAYSVHQHLGGLVL
jgi:hypothetical protein